MTLRRNSQDGFTLIDTAVMLIVFSLILVPMLQYALKKTQLERHNQYFGEVSDLRVALRNYALEYGSLPAPANPTLPMNHTDFGIPVNDSNHTAPALPTVCPGGAPLGVQAVNGVICRQGNRGTTAPVNSQRVYIGAVPTNALGLKPEDAVDMYGNKYTYAVTTAFVLPGINVTPSPTTPAPDFGNNRGVIRLLSDETGNDATGTSRNIEYLVMSHGENGAGAYNANGTLNACPIGAALENENCDGDSTFVTLTTGLDTNNDGIIDTTNDVIVDSYNLATGNAYFDDALKYSTSLTGEIWTPKASASGGLLNATAGALNGVTELQIGPDPDPSAPSGIPTISVGTGNRLLPFQASVVGDVRADQILTTRICDVNVDNCFMVDDIMTDNLTVDTGQTPNVDRPLKCSQYPLESVGLYNRYGGGNKRGLGGRAGGNCDDTVSASPASLPLGTPDPISGIVCSNGARDITGNNLTCL